MLTTVKTFSLEFKNPAGALQHFNSQNENRHLVLTQNLRMSTDGRLSHSGGIYNAFDGIPLIETALKQLNSLLGISESYSNQIDPKLHAHSINELLKTLDASVSVVVSSNAVNPDQQHISAILPGDCCGIPHSIIVERLEFWGLRAKIQVNGGEMRIEFGTPKLLEVLPEDHVKIMGVIHNTRWTQRASTRPSLESNLYWNRLVCSNGAYLQRVLGKGRLMSLGSKKEASIFVDSQIKRILSFEQEKLIPAVKTMAETIPNEDKHHELEKLLTRSIGEKKASELLGTVVSYWDEFNAITEAAHYTTNQNKARKLQIAGGELLESFLV
jgi:hypothetical protein